MRRPRNTTPRSNKYATYYGVKFLKNDLTIRRMNNHRVGSADWNAMAEAIYQSAQRKKKADQTKK